MSYYTTVRAKIKVSSVCGHSCGQSRFCAAFSSWVKSSKRRCHKALRRFTLSRPGYRHGTPKAGALPTALHPVIELFIRLGVFSQSKRATNCANPGFLVIEFCARCGQTCGQAVFLTTSTCGGSACIADVSRDCGHGIFRLEGGATRSQTRRDTNFAIPGYY